MKKKAIAAALSSLLVLSMGTAAFAADSQSSTEITATIEGGYTVTIPTSIDLGTVGAEDFAPKPMQTTEYGVFEEDYQYMVDTDFDIKVDGWYADNQYVKVTTDKIATLTDSGSEATVPVTVYPYERAFDEAATKTSTVTLYKDDAHQNEHGHAV